MIKRITSYFTKGELLLWSLSVLWVLVAMKDVSYLSVVVCFVVFAVNDIYGYINWSKMKRHQARMPEGV